jgi:phospholipid/cholesterol/gamma-HCH transport system substrate-binding protein
MEEITGRLARGEGTAGRLLADAALYDRIDGLAGRMDSLLTALESGSGTAGQLLRDRQLYDNANRVTLELARLLDDIRADPKKYLSVQFSVF